MHPVLPGRIKIQQPRGEQENLGHDKIGRRRGERNKTANLAQRETEKKKERNKFFLVPRHKYSEAAKKWEKYQR